MQERLFLQILHNEARLRKGIMIMSICINCGCECEGVLCAACDNSVDKEMLCLEISAYDPENCTNELWNKIAASMLNKSDLRDIAFAVAHSLPSPRKEYMTLVYLLGTKDYVPKNSRKWLYDNYDILAGDGVSESEKKTAGLALFYSYYYDYRYNEADEIAVTLYECDDLEPKEVYALADYFVKTRRYEQADELILNCMKNCSSEYYSKQLAELLDNSRKRQLGKQNGGIVEYIPAAPENKVKYVEFMKTIGIDVQMPVKYERRKREHIAAADYPRLPVFRDAGFRSFVAYDIETTGLRSAFDSIIEIGAVRVVDGMISEEQKFTFQTFVHPYKTRINDHITGITGITNEMVRNAPEMWDAFNEFADFVGDDILLGFNNNIFDDRFIERAGRYANRVITNKSFDVLTYAKRFKNALGAENLKLGTVSSLLGIENPQAHRALADAITTARVYLKLLDMDNSKPSVSLDDMLNDDDWE